MATDGDHPPVPAAPWRVRAEILVWVHRPATPSALPAALGRRRPWLTVGGLLRYSASPVDAYAELFAGLLLPGRMATQHVPFVAVDSRVSLRGGHRNWALPKTMAAFTGRPGTDRCLRAGAGDWELEADVEAFGPLVPLALWPRTVQVWPDGTARSFGTRIWGRAQLGRVTVRIDGAGSPQRWLLPGRSLAVRWPDARMVVQRPSPASRRR